MRSLLPLRSLTVKLALVLFGVVFVVIGVLELVVVPRLESRLVDARLDRLEGAGPSIQADLPQVNPFLISDRLRDYSLRYEARAVVFATDPLRPVADSSQISSPADIALDPLVRRVVRTGAPASARIERNDRAFAEVAFPVEGAVVLLSAPLSDVLESFDLMRRSLLIAGGLALLGAALVAWAAAWGLTRRLRHLEGAAERIAAGDFSEPVVDRGRDEVAQLAVAFEEMRQRLSHLERARREFIQNASHELRTPLFSLGGFLELLADEELDEATRREFLGETRMQVERLTKLATDLLDLSRLDAGRMAVADEGVDLADVARTACEEFRAVAVASGHELTAARADGVVASADGQRVLQIARILVQNAIRHTPAGTAVEIGAHANGDRAQLTVRDGGPGIPAEALPHLFERFYRAEGGRTSGSGLGLAIASELARMMHGAVTVESRPGQTVFRLVLPFVPPGAFRRENASGGDGSEVESAPEPARS